MPGIDRHAHAGARHRKAWDLQDRAAFVAQLQLFFGVAVLDIDVVERHHVEGDARRPFLAPGAKVDGAAVARQPGRSRAGRLHLGFQLGNAGQPAA
jgi:hypothetical protein